MVLMKHWNLYDTLVQSPYTSTRLQSWTENGREKIRHLLTEVGIKTSDAHQLYKVMSMLSKDRLDSLFESKASDDRYKLPHMRMRNFQRQLTPTLVLSAVDVVHAVSALLELPPHDSKERHVAGSPAAGNGWEAGFWRAMDALEPCSSDRTASHLLLRGISSAIHLQNVLTRHVTELMTTSKSIHPAGAFRWVRLSEGLDSIYLSHPLALTKLATYLYEAIVQHPDMFRGAPKPLVLASPIMNAGTYIVVAITGTMLTPGDNLRKSVCARGRDSEERMSM
jgi:cell division control protein 45